MYADESKTPLEDRIKELENVIIKLLEIVFVDGA